MLSLLFGMSQSVISTMIITTIDILYQEFMSVIRLPRFRGATVAIIYDGSEQKVVKPIDHINEQAIYSAKKKNAHIDGNARMFTERYNIPSKPQLFRLCLGSNVDGVVIKFPENSSYIYLDFDEYIGGDKGFYGLQEARSKVILPFKIVNATPLTESESAFNNEWASYRTVVENVFAHIKKWNACKDQFRLTQEQGMEIIHTKIWRIVASLYNLYVALFYLLNSL